MDNRRYVFLMGAIKAGTTSLYHYVCGHPQVSPCRQGEIAFFTDPELYARGFDWYEQQWDFDPERHRVAFEHSANYTKDPFIASPAARIASHVKDPRFLYLVRDPIERIESHYNAGLKIGWFGYEARITDDNFICPTRYCHQLRCYEEHFPRESILVLNHEDLKRDRAGLVKRVIDFLELDPDVPLDLDAVHNPTAALTRGEALAARFRGGLLKSLVPRPVRRFVKQALAGKSAPKVRLTERDAREIYRLIGEDIEEFVERYGFDPRSARSRELIGV